MSSNPTPEEIALAAIRDVKPGRFGVCIYVCRGDGVPTGFHYVIWTRGQGWGRPIYDLRLRVSETSPEQLASHVKDFCINFTFALASDF